MAIKVLVVIIIIFVAVATYFFIRGESFQIPRGDTITLEEFEGVMFGNASEENSEIDKSNSTMPKSTREVFVTDGVKHSIPLDEILSGGPPKDGIPSIDSPKFIGIKEAEGFLKDSSVGLGIVYKGTKRFYPYQILVWHEIVNDTIADDPIVVTYCPLCATGVVFERKINGKPVEFGVSGKLWQSNLLMYNRSDNPENESLWSQVLGEAVLGIFTGFRLSIIPSDTVLYGDWKKKYADTEVLSRNTGATRIYGSDPYGDYYTDDTVSFGATFSDSRLHQKEIVLGIEVNGKFKAYHSPALTESTTTDTFDGELITIEKSDIGEVRMFIGENKTQLPYIAGFWFSWLAVHPNTELYK
ncbi:DUF3179 domain-containing protein [Patescibacteria group bacterium]|nr:DUF3179 domain-containing protein [Patescibacteria group bacterium]